MKAFLAENITLFDSTTRRTETTFLNGNKRMEGVADNDSLEERLIQACKTGQISVVLECIEMGADVNKEMKDGKVSVSSDEMN